MAMNHSVAAGDTTQDSTVLWVSTTTLGNVTFEYSTNPNFFGSITRTQTATISDPLVPAKVQATGLTPDTDYFYRVKDSQGKISTGQFRTSAKLGTRTGLRFGVSGDWQGELSPYPSIANADDRNLEFFVQMGDTVEMDSASPALPGVRQAKTLEQFRIKHKEIYTERFGVRNWSDLRASTTVYSTWDDHEITGDFAGGAPARLSPQREGIFGTGDELVNDNPAFNAALQAFQEYKPLRDEFYGETGDPRTANEQKLYRYNTFGNDAASFVLDVRSFRDAPLPFVAETASQAQFNQVLQDAFNPNRTMLGAVQLQQFKNDLLKAQQDGITWKFVMSTVPMQNFGIPTIGERWEGFAAERTNLLKFIKENNIQNVVFVTGDFHGHVVNNLTYQEGFGQPQIQTDAIDVMIGPVAIQLNVPFLPAPFNTPFGAPFGPATVGFTPPSLLAQQGKTQAQYLALTDRAQKDQFVREVLDDRITKLGYDPIGLEGSGIDATLLKGEYLATHTYGWTEFEIDPLTQKLTVTTYGVEPYNQAELEANPTAIANRVPEIVNQFVVNPKGAIAASAPKLKNTANKIFQTEGNAGFGNFNFTLTQNNASFVNELGFFTVDDEQGRINGISPGQTGYLTAALTRGQVILSGVPRANSSANSFSRNLSLPANQRLMFYLVQNGTTDTVLTGQSNSNVLFGLAAANANNFDYLQVTSEGNEGFKLAWEDQIGGGDRDFDDFVVSVQPTTAPTNNSANFQSKSELIDLSDRQLNQSIAANLVVNSEAAFDNFAGFYVVQDVQGTVIDQNGNAIAPDQAGYAQAAIRQSQVNFNRNAPSSINLTGGQLLAPFLITNSTLENFLSQNPNNQQGNGPLAYFAYVGANPDKVDHVRQLGTNTFGFEDIFGGGDLDFNDLIVRVNFT